MIRIKRAPPANTDNKRKAENATAQGQQKRTQCAIPHHPSDILMNEVSGEGLLSLADELATAKHLRGDDGCQRGEGNKRHRPDKGHEQERSGGRKGNEEQAKERCRDEAPKEEKNGKNDDGSAILICSYNFA